MNAQSSSPPRRWSRSSWNPSKGAWSSLGVVRGSSASRHFAVTNAWSMPSFAPTSANFFRCLYVRSFA